MKAEEKAEQIASEYHFLENEPKTDEAMQARIIDGALQMYQWAEDEFMRKAENAYCNQCKKNPCRNKIEHGSLCYKAEIFLKQILKES